MKRGRGTRVGETLSLGSIAGHEGGRDDDDEGKGEQETALAEARPTSKPIKKKARRKAKRDSVNLPRIYGFNGYYQRVNHYTRTKKGRERSLDGGSQRQQHGDDSLSRCNLAALQRLNTVSGAMEKRAQEREMDSRSREEALNLGGRRSGSSSKSEHQIVKGKRRREKEAAREAAEKQTETIKGLSGPSFK
ncbi:hypothetical protein MGYG_09002 [Nannizzia gypsea CBS 118893]|uniref:Uncharacterized protein n=1 Tax=Arthroderma gypseum (strain ATCC MYA-4604 / CBS 118893) TaxID=535722 RepID=E4UPT1_ARTGP|nr:hypothetical protein MGYG_09002 [Nannizzia gypsea CBS 118893]EFQ99903.1 hypothetical protein MGYG_09002 [Nannizzia gypsea CBS 118893]